MKVTFLIPTLNEEEGIGATLDDIDKAAFRKRGWDVDSVIVDGHSTDRTREEAQARGAHVIMESRRGYGRAYKTGFAAVDGDILVTGDADGTYPFDRAHDYVAALLEEDLDFINCDRYGELKPGAMSRKHRLGNWVLSSTMRTLFRVKVKDSQSGMWVIRRSALDRIPFRDLSDGMAFSQEIKIEAWKRPDVRCAEIAGELRPRIGEPVIMSWTDGFGNLGALLRKRLTSRWSGQGEGS